MLMTRRSVLAAAPAAAAAAISPAWGQETPPAPAPSASQQAPGFYRYKIGDIEVDRDERRLFPPPA